AAEAQSGLTALSKRSPGRSGRGSVVCGASVAALNVGAQSPDDGVCEGVAAAGACVVDPRAEVAGDAHRGGWSGVGAVGVGWAAVSASFFHAGTVARENLGWSP